MKKGQSVLEYIIVVTAIVLGIITLARGAFKTAVESSINKAGSSIDRSASKLP